MAKFRVGCCVSGHGFGHAARTLGVMEALAGMADTRFTIASSVPEWFFRTFLDGTFDHVSLQTDVGLVQHSSLHEDLSATLRELKKFYPLRRTAIDRLARVFAGCDLIVCDIAPIGIAAADSCGIPSVLLENFTWDWIYQGYIPQCPEFDSFRRECGRLYARADYHVQTMPLCGAVNGDLLAGPIARRVRSPKEDIRRRLGISPGQRMVLLSLGGGGLRNIQVHLPDDGRTVYIIAGDADEGFQAGGHIRVLATETEFFHPDLVAASDAVIGKVGYSTIAELYQAETAFGYISRQNFRESGPLVEFIRREMAGIELNEQELQSGAFAARLPELCTLDWPARRYPDGAAQCARYLLSLLEELTGSG